MDSENKKKQPDVVSHYSELFRKYGDSPQSVQLADRETQYRRFEVLTRQIPRNESVSVLDVGCGLGHLNEFLIEHGYDVDYHGTDVNPDFLNACKEKFPKSQFQQTDISSQIPDWQCDYIVLNGVFNNMREDPGRFLTQSLRHMYAATRKCMSFNFMSTYVDFADNELVYFHPESVFQFCKEEISPMVEMNHAYLVREGSIPFEVTMTVHRAEIEIRKRLATGVALGNDAGDA